MIQIFNTVEKSLEEEFVDFTGGISLRNKWLHLENPTDREIELIERLTGVDGDMIKAALDEEERARIETDEGDKLVLFDIPTIEEEENYYSYSTMPLGVIITDMCMITVCLKENSIISNFVNNRVKKLETARRTNFLYQLLYHTHVKFLQYLRQIDRSSQRIQTELHRSTKNKELIQLLDLENSLVYFSTSLRANALIIEKLGRLLPPRNEDDEALLEDVGIENRQALDMCNIYRDILSRLRFDNIQQPEPDNEIIDGGDRDNFDTDSGGVVLGNEHGSAVPERTLGILCRTGRQRYSCVGGELLYAPQQKGEEKKEMTPSGIGKIFAICREKRMTFLPFFT